MTKMAEFLDAHGLLLEMQEDLDVIMNPEYTHVGVGFAADTRRVKIVEFLSARPIMIHSLNANESGEIVVTGTVLKPQGLGVYAARIVNKDDESKMHTVAGPQHIHYDKDSHEFVITFEPQQEELFYHSEPKMVEIYMRANPDTIPYGDNTKGKVTNRDFSNLQNVFRLPMEMTPDPRVIKEDAADLEKYERD